MKKNLSSTGKQSVTTSLNDDEKIFNPVENRRNATL